MHVKSEEEHEAMHMKGESTESELDEEEEDEELIQLREGSEEERGTYTQVCVGEDKASGHGNLKC